jgi:hypothetical protein
MNTPSVLPEKIYYLYHNHHQVGPFNLFELADELNSTEPNAKTQLFCVGWTNWVSYDDLGHIQDVCAARRRHPEQFQIEASQKWADKLHEVQQRRHGAGSFAQFRLSMAPKIQAISPTLIPSPHRISWGLVMIIGIGCVGLGALFTLLFK